MAIVPDGTAYLMSLVTDTNPGGFDTNPDDMTVSQSTDHGATWEDPVSLNLDESHNSFNNKNVITADPNDSDLVSAVWDLVVSLPGGNQNQQAIENSAALPATPCSLAPPTLAPLGSRPGGARRARFCYSRSHRQSSQRGEGSGGGLNSSPHGYTDATRAT